VQAEMAHQGKQMEDGACKGFSYDSVKLVLLVKTVTNMSGFQYIFRKW
jgi:hypothetical protein